MALDATGGKPPKTQPLVCSPKSYLDCVSRLLAYYELHRRSKLSQNGTVAQAQNNARVLELEQARDACAEARDSAIHDTDRLRAEKSAAEIMMESAVAEVGQLRADLTAAHQETEQLQRNLIQEHEARAAARASETDTLQAMEQKLQKTTQDACAAKETTLGQVRTELHRAQQDVKDKDVLFRTVQDELQQAHLAIEAGKEREQGLTEQSLGLEKHIADLNNILQEATAAAAVAEKHPAENETCSKIRTFVRTLASVLQQRPLLFESLQGMSDNLEKDGIDLEGSRQVSEQLESIVNEHEDVIRKIKQGADRIVKKLKETEEKLNDVENDCQVYLTRHFP